MINFSKISADSFIGKFLRRILKIIPADCALPILQGKLRGKKWIISSGVFSYWLGNYETEKQELFEKKVKKGDVVFDIGAQAGFYTLLAAELVGEKGRVFAFEPVPENIAYLKKNIALNNYKNISVREEAVSGKSGVVYFKRGESGFTGRIGEGGDLKVNAVSLDDLVEKGNLPAPNVLKIDVEGEEVAVLRGAISILAKYHPSIFLAIHKENEFDKISHFLKELRYNLIAICGGDIKKDGEIFASFNK